MSEAEASTASKTSTVAKQGADAAPEKAAAPRGESKGAKILEMVARPKGVTLSELMETNFLDGS